MALEASIRIIYDRRKKASATVKGGVEIEVYYNRQRIRFATGVNVLKQHWKGGMVVSHPKAQELNEQIISLYETIDQRITTMRRRGVIDLNLLKEAKVEEENNSSNFLDWLEDRIYKRDIKESTRRQHFVMLGELRKFGKIVNFRDLTTRNIKLWDDSLRERLGAQSSVHGYHKRLKPYILEAIQLELIKDNPYNGMKISRGKSEGIKYLTEAERNRIEQLEVYGPIEKARDMFIFSCYTGLAYSDLIRVSKDCIYEENGEYFIKDRRLKTNNEYTIMLLPQAYNILLKYNFDLNLMTNQKCNEYLKIIAQQADIHMNLTFHVGRHTFATWALSNGVDIATVKDMLAHSSIEMTITYAKVLNKQVVDGFQMLKRKAAFANK